MDIHVLDPDDLDAVLDLGFRAFGPPVWPDRQKAAATEAIAEGRVLGGYDGSRLVASSRYFTFDQWWHGRAVPMGGVAGVSVAPEERGRGIGRRLVAATLDHMEPLPLSTLYPATAPVYRSVGYEHGGSQHLLTIPADALRTLGGGPVAVRRAGPGDAAEIVAVLRRLHAAARDSGPIDRGEAYVRDVLADDRVYAYLADDGFLAYGWVPGGHDLTVHRCVAGSAEIARALWAIVGSGSSIATTVTACVAPHDPLLWLLRDRSTDEVRRVSWMLRVLDAEPAIGARGFPVGLTAEACLVLHDAQRSGNGGAWLLSVGDGRGRLTPMAEPRDAVRLSARGFAALYAGVPVSVLRRSGLADGGEGADSLLDAAFAATPYMLDYF